MSVVPGDPASLSACASTARSVGHGLTGQASRVRATSRELAQGWTGRTSAGVRQRASGLADATDAAASELDRMGRVLQDHASDLADLVARGRAVEERARAAGLVVRDGRVELYDVEDGKKGLRITEAAVAAPVPAPAAAAAV